MEQVVEKAVRMTNRENLAKRAKKFYLLTTVPTYLKKILLEKKRKMKKRLNLL